MEIRKGSGGMGQTKNSMKRDSSGWPERLGLLLFRYRSFTPLPLLLACLFLFKPVLWGNLWVQGGTGMLVSLMGLGVRFLAVGYARQGTSGRESYLRAEALNTDGIYSWVRNPLYWGNILIFTGLLVTHGSALALGSGLLYLILQYHFVILSEEAYLRATHGDAYLAYCRETSRWLPGWGTGLRGERVWSWKRILARENDAMFNLWMLWWGLILWQRLRLDGEGVWPFWGGLVLGTGILTYGWVKLWKRQPEIRDLAR